MVTTVPQEVPMRHIALPLIMVALAAAEPTAGCPQRGQPDPFTFFDRDGDGAVTAAEFAPPQRPEHPGMPDEAERTARHQAAFAAADADGDGRLTKDELAVALAKLREAVFARIDADHDGAISRDEFLAIPHPGQGAGKGDGQGKGPGQGQGHGGRHGPPDPAAAFAKADADGDGKLTVAEFATLPPPHPHRGHGGCRAPAPGGKG
jgi:Ca2+-binding EF-hand superfamily protein